MTNQRQNGLRDDYPRPDLLEIRDFNLHRYDAADLTYQADDVSRPSGTDDRALLFRLNVDGQYDIVSADLGQTTDLRMLERAIDGLTLVRDRLERIYGEQQPWTGLCVEHGDWGRCELRDGHEGDHALPTQAE